VAVLSVAAADVVDDRAQREQPAMLDAEVVRGRVG
jgi:hypothetical protein